ncbi:putative nwd2 protein [Mycena venus]|uniref:Putative nwd2 protein n=1 Tax=Mycena venus TaxID=2733690 RepID=A0A8H6Y4Q0_9AGAR|nr:putative nwd2 protein [Mycena venus]
MFHQASQTVINYIFGGTGGTGGGGGVRGQGGDGGTGEAPALNYAITAQNVTMNTHPSFQNDTSAMHILHRAIAVDALYNSAERFPQPRCHPETRTELIEKLCRWVTDANQDHSIHWLHGPAGAGKSAIMQTLCERLQEAGRLGGSFFFKRGHSTCGNAKVLFATLAYQLALHRPKLKRAILRSVETDLSVLGRSLDVQLQNLILIPWKLADGSLPSALLIDGLDECDGHKIQQEILRLIGSTANKHHPALRIIVASRPEPHIRETFEEESLQGVADTTNIEQSFHDVWTYLRNEFSRIHREHFSMKNVPTPWPSPQILNLLVERSSGYFIYASTAIRFIDDEYFSPCKQLHIIIQNLPLDSESPFATLDQLYIQILKEVPSRHLGILSDIFSAVIHLSSCLRLRDMDELFGLEPGNVELTLRPLHSILQILEDKSGQLVIQVHHASFLDFLKDAARSSSFYVGSTGHKAKLGQSILNTLAYTYDNPRINLADFFFYWHVEGALSNVD